MHAKRWSYLESETSSNVTIYKAHSLLPHYCRIHSGWKYLKKVSHLSTLRAKRATFIYKSKIFEFEPLRLFQSIEAMWGQWDYLRSMRLFEVNETIWSQWGYLRSMRLFEVTDIIWGQWGHMRSMILHKVNEVIWGQWGNLRPNIDILIYTFGAKLQMFEKTYK